jgi:cysteine desulfurase
MDVLTDPIYLDHNATTPLLPEVVDAMLPFLRVHFGNPSSAHVFGRRANDAVTQARSQVAALIGCDADEIVFTSGGSESNNLAIKGVQQLGGVITSVIEHPATAQPCAHLERQGRQVTRLAVDAFGQVRLSDARAAIQPGAALVTVMHSNNETGTLQPIAELANLARENGALMHTDAAQSIGKVPIDVRALGVDLLTIAGHKLYAPKGVGALYVRRGIRLTPQLVGAGHEGGLRAGTENVASIVGLGVACDVLRRSLAESASRQTQLRGQLWDRLSAEIPSLELNGHPTQRLPNTLNVSFPDATGDVVLAGAPEVAAATGAACHAGERSASAVLLAMGCSKERALGAVRLSVGRDTHQGDVDAAAKALAGSWRSTQ